MSTFSFAYSSDSGRMGDRNCPYYSRENILREKKFLILSRNGSKNGASGSLEGGYDMEMWGVIPRVLNFKTYDEMGSPQKFLLNKLPMLHTIWIRLDGQKLMKHYEIVCGQDLKISPSLRKKRRRKCFESYHMVLTIAFLLNLIDPKQPVRAGLLNGSVTKVTYANGRFSILGINDTSYIENGKAI